MNGSFLIFPVGLKFNVESIQLKWISIIYQLEVAASTNTLILMEL